MEIYSSVQSSPWELHNPSNLKKSWKRKRKSNQMFTQNIQGGGGGGVDVSAYRHVTPHPISFSNIKVLIASRISFNEMDEGEGKQRE
jgi:hypothetical protein